MKNITGKFCYSLDQEQYHGQFDTQSAAAGTAISELENEFDPEPGEERSYWIAECCHPLDTIMHDRRLLWAGESFLEHVDEWCGDEIAAEDNILDLSADDKIALGKLVFDFLRERASVNYYGIKNPVEHKHVIKAAEES